MKSIDTSTQTFKEIFLNIKENLNELEFKLNNNGCRFFSETHTATEGQEFFPLENCYTPNNNCVRVYKNGIRQFYGSGFFELTSYQNKTAPEWLKENGIGALAGEYVFTPPCAEGDVIVIEYKEVFPVADNTILEAQIIKNINDKTVPIIQNINDTTLKQQNEFTAQADKIDALLEEISNAASRQKESSDEALGRLNTAMDDLAVFKEKITNNISNLARCLNLKLNDYDEWTEIVPKLKNITKTDIVVSMDSWIKQETTELYPEKSESMFKTYPYIATIPIDGVTPYHSCDVRFAFEDAMSGRFACVCDTGDGIVRLFAINTPNKSVVIPVMILTAIN